MSALLGMNGAQVVPLVLVAAFAILGTVKVLGGAR